MATRSNDESPGETPQKLPQCSICEGTMILAYDRYRQKICICLDCHTSMTIPGSAWEVAKEKRAARAREIPERRQSNRRSTDTRLHS